MVVRAIFPAQSTNSRITFSKNILTDIPRNNGLLASSIGIHYQVKLAHKINCHNTTLYTYICIYAYIYIILYNIAKNAMETVARSYDWERDEQVIHRIHFD